MSANLALKSYGPARRDLPQAGERAARELLEQDRERVLAFLSEDPLSGLHLRSAIQDHGLCHPAHRGRFFGYFEDGRLAGVALLGHIISFCAPDEALGFFAQAASEIKAKGHVIFGRKEQVEAFWGHFSQFGRETKKVCDQQWYVCRRPQAPIDRLQLRQANLDELKVVAEAQAEMIVELSGTDPRVADPEGFRLRTAERIGRKRTWVKVQDGKVVFKAELQAVTEEAVYLEGVWTHPEYRGRGIAKSCLAELTHRLLKRHLVVCLAVEPKEQAAKKVYEHAGFAHQEDYQARFLQPMQS